MTPGALLEKYHARRRERQARAWVVRLDEGREDLKRDRALASWLAKPANEAAFARAATIWLEIDRAALTRRVEAARLLRWTPRRARPGAPRTASMAVAASIALCAWWGPATWIALSADVRTGPFETRTIALGDGSRIELSSRSAVDIAYLRGERRVKLLEGEAAFSVAPDTSRPFVVSAKGGETRALGTEFLVAWRDGGIKVTGIEHRVRVSAAGEPREIGAGQSVFYGRFAEPEKARVDAHAGAWRRGIVQFENRPLGEIADELERYADCSIWVLGNARSHAFSGTFRIASPIAGLRAAAKTADLRVVELPGVVLIAER